MFKQINKKIKMRRIESYLNRRADNILGIIYCLSLLSNTDEFEQWMSSNHDSPDISSCSNGYWFTYKLYCDRLIDEIIDSPWTGLTHDESFDRAVFRGININKLPNTCEKVKLVKSLKSDIRHVFSDKKWQKFKERVDKFSADTLEKLWKIKNYSKVITALSRYTLDGTILYAAMFETYLFFNDTRRNSPHSYIPKTESELLYLTSDAFFTGYKFCVQYLWSCVLGSKFQSSVVSQIHQANNWAQFDDYYEKIREEIIWPLETRLGVTARLTPLIVIEGNTKPIFKELISKNIKEPQLSVRDALEQLFLWYYIEIIDSGSQTEYSSIFAGVPALASSIVGSVEIRRKKKIPGVTKVIKLKHPDGMGNSTYSFAILMNVTGFFSDASGWLMFLECCYDHTDTGLRGLEFVDSCIKPYLKTGAINITEYSVNKEEFLKVMKPHLLSVTKSELTEILQKGDNIKQNEDKLSTARGLLLELLVFYLYSYPSAPDKKIEWNYKNDGIQIDVIVKQSNNLFFYECKTGNQELSDQAKQFKKKVLTLVNNKSFRSFWSLQDNTKYQLAMVTWNDPPFHVREKMKEDNKDIGIMVMEKELKANARLASKNKDKLRHVFDKHDEYRRNKDSSYLFFPS